MEAIRVLCVEDNEFVADALERKLKREGGFEWLGWVSTPEDLYAKVRDGKPHVAPLWVMWGTLWRS